MSRVFKSASIAAAFLVFLFSAQMTTAGTMGATHGDVKKKTIEGLKERYSSIDTLSASFTQEAFSKILQSEEVSEGKLFLKRPGQMRWAYLNGERIISDGVTLWYFQPDFMQVVETSATGAAPNIALDFLTGIATIEDDFEITLGGVEEGLIIVKLAPREKLSGVKELAVFVDKEHLIRRTVVTDHFGNETRVSLTDIKTNKKLDDKLFQLDVPKGTKVVKP